MLYAGGDNRDRTSHPPRTLQNQACVRLAMKWKDDSGAEILEAALILPVLLMLLLGIIAFGRAWNTYQTITRAAREGARMAVMTPCAIYPSCPGSNTIYDAAQIRTDFVEPALAAANLDTSKIKDYSTTYVFLDPDDSTPDVCGVQLSFKYPFTFLLPFTSVNAATIDLSTTVRMRLESPPTTCPAGTPVP